jgi:hypothetical protein
MFNLSKMNLFLAVVLSLSVFAGITHAEFANQQLGKQSMQESDKRSMKKLKKIIQNQQGKNSQTYSKYLHNQIETNSVFQDCCTALKMYFKFEKLVSIEALNSACEEEWTEDGMSEMEEFKSFAMLSLCGFPVPRAKLDDDPDSSLVEVEHEPGVP